MPTVPTSWCYFFWPVLIFGKYTRKTDENTRKQAKNRRFFGANFLGGKLVGANFYAFCNYASVGSLNAHGNPARLFPPSTPHQGGDLVGYQVKSSKCIFRTFLLRKSIFFCNFVQDYSQLLRDILGGTKGHPLVARIL